MIVVIDTWIFENGTFSPPRSPVEQLTFAATAEVEMSKPKMDNVIFIKILLLKRIYGFCLGLDDSSELFPIYQFPIYHRSHPITFWKFYAPFITFRAFP